MTNVNLKRNIILLLILAGIGAAILYLDMRFNFKTPLAPKNTQSQQIDKKGDTIDCSNKIAQDKNQLTQGSKSNNCLFLGCGDFF